MRLAPAVSVTASNAGLWRSLQLSVLAGSCGVGAAWAAMQLGASGLAALGAAAACCAAVAVVAHSLMKPSPTVIRWTGTTWQQGSGPDGGFIDLASVEVAIDLGTAVLLRLHPVAGVGRWSLPDWAAVTRREAGPDFRAFCVALYAPGFHGAVAPGSGNGLSIG